MVYFCRKKIYVQRAEASAGGRALTYRRKRIARLIARWNKILNFEHINAFYCIFSCQQSFYVGWLYEFPIFDQFDPCFNGVVF